MAELKVSLLNRIKSEIHVPGDKSISHRAIMLGALAKGDTVVNNFLKSGDCLATIDCFRKLGIEVRQVEDGGRVAVKGKGIYGLKPSMEILNVGNSGTTIRLMTGILAGQAFNTKITGDESIKRRPMLRVINPLSEMGANIEGHKVGDNVYPPLSIFGSKLSSINYILPVASAQVKSAILLAGLYAKGETAVVEKNRARDHTERMMSHFGIDIHLESKGARIIGQKEFPGAEIDVPGDISSAAFFMVAGLLVKDSKLLIREVGLNSTRTGISEILHRMGGEIDVQNEKIISEEPRGDILIKTSKLKGIKIFGEIIPRIIDEIPIIAVAATQAEGITEIRGADELRVKESDRIKTVSSELRKFGAKITELNDGMIIEGPTKLKAARVKSYGDHRIAMATAIAGLLADGETIIEDTDCIETSFPGFSGILNRLGT